MRTLGSVIAAAFAVAAASFSLDAACAPTAGAAERLRQAVAAWQSESRSTSEIKTRLRERFVELGLRRTADATSMNTPAVEVAAAFDALAQLSFYSRDRESALQLERAGLVLAMQGALTPAQTDALRGAATAQRQFASARSWSAYQRAGSYPDLPATIRRLPVQPVRSAWQVHPVLDELEQVEITLAPGVQVVAISHPLCGFSRNAFAAISSDAELSGMLRGRIVALTPQDRTLDDAAIRRWNRRYPDWTHSIVNAESEWPMLERWNTPTFYVFRDGKLRGSVEGWPKDGSSRNLLLAALRGGAAP